MIFSGIDYFGGLVCISVLDLMFCVISVFGSYVIFMLLCVWIFKVFVMVFLYIICNWVCRFFCLKRELRCCLIGVLFLNCRKGNFIGLEFRLKRGDLFGVGFDIGIRLFWLIVSVFRGDGVLCVSRWFGVVYCMCVFL